MTSDRVRPREVLLPQLNGVDDYVNIDGVVESPKKKMRGRVTDKLGADLLKSNGEGGQSWAMVPYKSPLRPPNLSLEPDVKHYEEYSPSRPNAVRYCPPGMRIRGSRGWPPPKQTSVTKSKVKLTKLEEEEPFITLLSDSGSDRDQDHRAVLAKGEGSSKPPPRKTKTPGRVTILKKNSTKHSIEETVHDFEATAPELTSGDPRTRVKFVLKQFDNLRRLYSAHEEQRVREAGCGSRRADFRASKTLCKNNCRVNGVDSIYGEVPGVEVGDFYYYRIELLLISLHRQSQGGIDFIPATKSEFRDIDNLPMSVAVSVIASGGYEDDQDEGDTLIYTGQGGNNYKGDKRQGVDQELVRGNLALKNCCDYGLSVRVIRGCDIKRLGLNQESPSGKVYYYDGLYDVKDCFQEQGTAGFRVWKYRLVRRAGQKPLSSSLVMFQGKTLPPVLKERGENVILDDLSNGLEVFKVRVVGSLEDSQVPTGFTYIISPRFPPGLRQPSLADPCSCTKGCWKKSDCSCLRLNGGPAYNEDGALLRAKRLVYECGPHCGCRRDAKCTSRVTQKGLRYNLEVFKTAGKGWGVRSSNFIPQGGFVCEYIGEIIPEAIAEKRVEEDEYMFDLKIPDSMERRFGDVSQFSLKTDSESPVGTEKEEDEVEEAEKYTADAFRFGNLARFINHSCEPNLFVQCVLYDHHDHRFPHVMLFASEHIPPYKELTYDYGYELNKIQVNGKIKVKECYCGARKCRGRMY